MFQVKFHKLEFFKIVFQGKYLPELMILENDQVTIKTRNSVVQN